MPTRLDLSNKTFGNLLVLYRVNNIGKDTAWMCKCLNCNNVVPIKTRYIIHYNKTDCGCVNKNGNKYEIIDNYVKVYFNESNDYFICDISDWFEFLNKHTYTKDNRGYVVSHEGKIHRLIMNPKKNEDIDHINGNPLDNRRKNLRICKHKYNCRNKRINKNNTSGYAGISWNSRVGMWSAEIKVNYKKIHLGYYKDKEEAIKKRMEAEIKYFGEYSIIESRNSIYTYQTLDEILRNEKEQCIGTMNLLP